MPNIISYISTNSLYLYYLIYRYPPFFDDQPFVIYEKILAGKIDWPKHIDLVAKYV